MLSSSNLMAPPLYLELAPTEEAAKQIDHLFVFRDTGVLSGGGRGRFATDLFTLSVTRDDSGGGRVSLAEPRPYFSPRPKAIPGCRGRAATVVTTAAISRLHRAGHAGLRTGPDSDRGR